MRSRRPAASGGRRWGRTRKTGLVLALVVLGLLAWVGYEYFYSNVVAAASYRQQVSALPSSWAAAGAEASGQPAPGAALAVLRVPAWGADYEVPVLAGTDRDLLSRGVGHYPTSAAPGQVGNCALAGLRVTHGQPFARLHQLDRGARVLVETRRAIFTYVIDVPPRDLTVRASDSWVLQPVPGQPRAKPAQALLTLTTAQDVLPTSDRSVGFAHLASTQNKG